MTDLAVAPTEPTAPPGPAPNAGSRTTAAVAHIDNTTPEVGASWFIVALATEVGAEPVRVELLGRAWVLARLGEELVAFVDACPHRLLPLSAGTICGDVLRCGYHGWEYDTSGRAVVIPSLEPGSPITGRAQLERPGGLVEAYGAIWLAPDEPVTELPEFPEWDDLEFDTRIDDPVRLSAGFGQVMDNACDASHFVTVHAGTFGGQATAQSFPRIIERDGWALRATYESPYQVLDDPRTISGELPVEQPTLQTKTFRPGASLHLRIDFPGLGSAFTIFIAVQPEREGSTRIYRWFARNDIVGDEARWADCLVVEQAVLAEDVTVLSQFRDHRLHLDLRREVHVPADKLSLAYRRLLMELVEAHPSNPTTDPLPTPPMETSR
ncbi:molybdenum cofactor-independent xanthine hydroxylase subunit HpxD [soil metagenome]